MEPRLNIKVAELFDRTAAPAQNPNFVPQGTPLPLDSMDITSNHFQQNMQAYMDQRNGLGAQIQQFADQGMAGNALKNPAQDRALMVMEPETAGTPDLTLAPEVLNAKPKRAASKLASQAYGFNNAQINPECTFGVVASASAESLVQARVVAETPTTKIAGTVIAVGDNEFAVIWDDKTASVERKGDYELVVTQ